MRKRKTRSGATGGEEKPSGRQGREGYACCECQHSPGQTLKATFHCVKSAQLARNFLLGHKAHCSHLLSPHPPVPVTSQAPPGEKEQGPGGKGEQVRTGWLGVRGEASQAQGLGKCRTGWDPFLHLSGRATLGTRGDGSVQGLRDLPERHKDGWPRFCFGHYEGYSRLWLLHQRTSPAFSGSSPQQSTARLPAILPRALAWYSERTWNRAAELHCLGGAEGPPRGARRGHTTGASLSPQHPDFTNSKAHSSRVAKSAQGLGGWEWVTGSGRSDPRMLRTLTAWQRHFLNVLQQQASSHRLRAAPW